MNIFNLHRDIIKDYTLYIRSFINIRDKDILKRVEDELTSGKLWPEPLIQFNPAYKKEGNISKLIEEGLLDKNVEYIFKGYTLYTHQVEALKLGALGKDFIVTSGTGSGKSLTYLGTIFNYLLKNKVNHSGIKAIIIYPMNALVNSQKEEISKYKENYEKETGKKFPITFAQYTGQENQVEREKIKTEIPDILLTNYMMLELILSRSSDKKLKDSIYDNLKFLVFDELHTYRGRQGADVAMLIRRIHYRCNNNIVCIGTSATMISEMDINEQKERVAEVASQIFGKNFSKEQIINETLSSALGNLSSLPSKDELRQAIINEVNLNSLDEEDLKQHPTVIWIEKKIALRENNGIFVRNQPFSLSTIASNLSNETGLSSKECRKHLEKVLHWISMVNIKIHTEGKPYTYIPFKLHQFISQTGSVHITLEPEGRRSITLDPISFTEKDNKRKPLYPVVFSRISGYSFVCVTKNYESGRFDPREFSASSEDEEDNLIDGYLILDENVWNPDTDMELLPGSWVTVKKNGKVFPKKEYKDRLPSKIFFNDEGKFSDKPKKEYPLTGWFMPKKLLFDPTSGTFFTPNTSEGAKLSQLGGEGRSTSTTITSFSILQKMADNGFKETEQKLLSFTDNRQDAALQTGHFNDFINTIKLRAAIYQALKEAGNYLDHTNIGNAVFKILTRGLHFSDWANVEKEPEIVSVREEYKKAFQAYLIYRILYDLRRGWRLNLPNLEQCGLLKIEYKNLKELAYNDNIWEKIPIIQEKNQIERYEIIYQILEHFRRSYAIHSEEYLTEKAINTHKLEIKERLKTPWNFGDKENIPKPNFMTYTPISARSKLYTKSIGTNSYLGKYLKNKLKIKNEEYKDFIISLMDILTKEGFLYSYPARDRNNTPVSIYQLRIINLIWKAGDGRTVVPDEVTLRSYKSDYSTKPNEYFASLYKSDYSKIKYLSAGEHTGQLTNEDRIQKEELFREGKMNILYCSPTMELGIDIANLNIVHMRNVPPTPANYAQRSGRAGRSGQAALVITYCSSYSSHDMHYFAHSSELVSGVVVPPKIDFCNEELLKTHLYALTISEIGLNELNKSVNEILSLDNKDLPLKEEIKDKLTISDKLRKFIINKYEEIIQDFKNQLSSKYTPWFTDNWIELMLSNFIMNFDKAFDRWRNLYKYATYLMKDANANIENNLLSRGSSEYKKEDARRRQGERQRDILCNKSEHNFFSEFYPYRYLASEGFLPGYNFTKLPLRAFIPKGDGGEYISRPRFIALREFGPRNRIYHSGAKYGVKQLIVQDAENQLERVKICKSSGYCLIGNDFDNDTCPLTHASIQHEADKEILYNLIPMNDVICEQQERITCEEEERISQGYDIATYFRIDNFDSVITADIKVDGIKLLHLRYIPAMRLIHINKKWMKAGRYGEEGFPIGLTTGFWKKRVQDREQAQEKIINVKPYTSNVADALYLEPTKPLAIDYNGVITLQFALKKAIENIFQAEPDEIGVTTLGGAEIPNILIYEAAEGSLGILSQFISSPDTVFNKVINKAIEICRYNEPGYDAPASYRDLLSYYNQRFHSIIDRFLIKDALEKLKKASVEVRNKYYSDYDKHYNALREAMDPNSSTEAEFLKYLYEHSLRLPDAAQPIVKDLYVRPDFFYEPNIYIFCDGSPHDKPEIREDDQIKRQKLISKGYQVIVYYYKDSLKDLISSRPDIFRKVR